MIRFVFRMSLVMMAVAACKPAPSSRPQVSAEAALEQLDTRVPVPLLPHMAQHQKENMREHLVAVQDIALAASRADFAAIEQASTKLGLSPGMERMCTHIGMGAPGFTEQALTFHRSAEDIAAAARKRDASGVMKALGATLHLCTGCHASYRQKVVDEATWTGLTATAAPMPHANGTSSGG
jgi:cytochrome c556